MVPTRFPISPRARRPLPPAAAPPRGTRAAAGNTKKLSLDFVHLILAQINGHAAVNKHDLEEETIMQQGRRSIRTSHGREVLTLAHCCLAFYSLVLIPKSRRLLQTVSVCQSQIALCVIGAANALKGCVTSMFMFVSPVGLEVTKTHPAKGHFEDQKAT